MHKGFAAVHKPLRSGVYPAPLPGPSQSQAAGLDTAGAGPATLLPAKMGWENREGGRGEGCEPQQRGTSRLWLIAHKLPQLCLIKGLTDV